MRKARVFVRSIEAGQLEELGANKFRFSYLDHYQGKPVSLTLPLSKKNYEFDHFPPFFEGLLPEGMQLEAMLRNYKLDRNDYFGQLLQVGHDTVGAITIEEIK